MKIIRKAIYLIVLVLIANLRLSAQEIVHQRTGYWGIDEDFLTTTAYTDNHFPELNEPVTITLKANIAENYLKYLNIKVKTKTSSKYRYSSRLGFNIRPDDGVEIISGKPMYDKPIKKVGTIEMKLTVKFTKSKYVRISAGYWFRGRSTDIPFYVGGAYYESNEVKSIKRYIEKMTKDIEDGKTPGIYGYRTKRGIRTVAPDIGKNHTFDIPKELLLKTKDKALEWNMQKYKKLRKEYDALAYVVQAIRCNSTRKHRRSNPNEKSYRLFLKEYNDIYKNGSDTNKHPILKKYKNILEEKDPISSSSGSSLNKGTSTKGTLRSNDVTAIKNHKSYYSYWIENKVISTLSTTVGTATKTSGETFDFYGGNTVAEGDLTITYTDGTTEILNVEVFGDFALEVDIDDGHNFYVKLYDLPVDGDEVFVTDGYLDDGEIIFSSQNLANYRLEIYPYNDKFVMQEITRTAAYNYEPAELPEDEIENATFFESYIILNATAPPEIARLGDVTEATELLYAFDNTIPKPVKIRCKDDISISKYDINSNLLSISAHLDRLDYDDISVILHELGHYYMNKKWNITFPGGPHLWGDNINPDLAFSEGWATYFSCYLNENEVYTDNNYGTTPTTQDVIIDIESEFPAGLTIPEGNNQEASTMNSLWDITDSPSETHDYVTISIDYIKNTIANMDKSKLSMNEFIKTWKDSYYTNIKDIVEYHALNYDGNACSPPPFWVRRNIKSKIVEQATKKGVTKNEK